MDEPTDSSEELTKLHPDHVKVTRIVAVLWMLVLAIPCAIVELALYSTGDSPIPNGPFIGLWLVLAVYIVAYLPHRRYINRGYHMGTDRIRIVRGYLFRSDTIVPFGRIQLGKGQSISFARHRQPLGYRPCDSLEQVGKVEPAGHVSRRPPGSSGADCQACRGSSACPCPDL